MMIWNVGLNTMNTIKKFEQDSATYEKGDTRFHYAYGNLVYNGIDFVLLEDFLSENLDYRVTYENEKTELVKVDD